MSGKVTRLSAITIAHTYEVVELNKRYYVGKSGAPYLAECWRKSDADRVAAALSVYDKLVLTHKSVTYADDKPVAPLSKKQVVGYSSYIEERGDGNWLHQTYPSEELAGGHYDIVWRRGRWAADQFFSKPGETNRLVQYAIDRCRVPYRVGNTLCIPVLGEV